MTNKNINCHPELVEGSQQNCISARDIAENAKLNHKIAEELRKYVPNRQLSCSGLPRTSRWLRKPCLTWIPVSHPHGGAIMTVERKFWMPYRKGFTLRGMTVLFFLACFPSFVQAETCTATPDCKTLGYTESSCPDGGGVKCPWNTSLMYCCKKCAQSCEEKSCVIGDVLYSDKKCYTCPNANTLPGQVPIGVVFSSGKAVGLVDLSWGDTWSNASTLCRGHKPGGISGWYLPSKDELLAMYKNINAVQTGLQRAIGDSKLLSYWYWSSSVSPDNKDVYYVVNPVSGSTTSYSYNYYAIYVRPVLKF